MGIHLSVAEALTKRIKHLIQEREMTLYQLALNAGIAHRTLANITRGSNKAANIKTLIKIAGGFDMTISEFLDHSMFDEDNLKL